MTQHLLKIDAALAQVEKWCVVVLFTAAAVMLLFNIVCRNVFGVSFQNFLEASPRVLFWAVLLGASLGLRHQRYIRLDVALRFISPVLQTTAGRLSGFFGAAVMIILLAASLDFVKNEIDMFGLQGWAALILPVFFALSALRFFIIAAVPAAGRGEEPSQNRPNER